jgi:hypothetical protein
MPLLEHGHHRRICQGRRTFQGLRAGRSRGRRCRIRWGCSTFPSLGTTGRLELHSKSRRTNNCYCATAPLDWQTYNAGYIHMEMRPRAPGLQLEVMTSTSTAGDRARSDEVCYTAGLDNAGCAGAALA